MGGAASKPAAPVSIGQLIADPHAVELALTVVAGGDGLGRQISAPRVQKPGLALTGYTEQLHDERLLVLGATEIDYLASIDADAMRCAIESVMAARPACLVVARGLTPPAELSEACEARAVPLLSSPLVSYEFMTRVTQLLKIVLAPSTSVHGGLLDVLGIGILLVGKSGIGKSEIALELVTRGHRLVADDIVNIRCQDELVYGSGSSIIRHHMEIRGLGIINIKDLFGIASVRETKKIELVVELAEWDAREEYDRLGVEEQSYEVLDAQVPMVRLPVRPGRNMATIIEVAARNQLLKFQGHHSAREFQERLNRAIAEAKPNAAFDVDMIE